MRLVADVGVERLLVDLAAYIEHDFRRWMSFDKKPRIAAHSQDGAIELMPTSDGEAFAFKYVNGHPKNARSGPPDRGRLRRARRRRDRLSRAAQRDDHSHRAAHRRDFGACRQISGAERARTMAIIGNGAQCEFQALAFSALVGVASVRLYDIDPAATRKAARNLALAGLKVTTCHCAEEAILGAEIITTCTADRARSRVLTDNMIGAGVHINAIGGDCPGKTELAPEILSRAHVFVEYPEQTRIEGEIQQMPADFPVTELWRVICGEAPGRRDAGEITLFDSVGFAIEDFAALRYVRDLVSERGASAPLDLVADPDDPRDLYGMLLRAGVKAVA